MKMLEDRQMSDTQLSELAIPPHSIEAEQSVLGGLLIDANAWENIAEIVNIHDFYRLEHRIIFEVIQKLISNNQPVDVVTVQEELVQQNLLENVGGFTYLVSLAQNTPSPANIRRYAEIMQMRSILRDLAQVGTEIARLAYQPNGKSTGDLLDEAESRVFQIAEQSQRGKQSFISIDKILKESLLHFNNLFANKSEGDVVGLATGFYDLDKMTQGLQAGDLIIIAGRPSMGKTAFAMNIAEHAGIHEKSAVAVFSMEMSGVQLVNRMIGSVGRVDQEKLRTGSFGDEDWQRVGHAVEQLSVAPIFIDETAGLTSLEVRARARRLARQQNSKEHKLGLIVIDYLQLMSGNSGRSDNRVSELSEISRSLKALAKELDVPVIALSQLSRKPEERTDHRPIMSDLRDSGAIEQDADLVMLMYRGEYYDRKNEDLKGRAEVIIGKHRNGATGTVNLHWTGHYARFDNAAHNNTL